MAKETSIIELKNDLTKQLNDFETSIHQRMNNHETSMINKFESFKTHVESVIDIKIDKKLKPSINFLKITIGLVGAFVVAILAMTFLNSRDNAQNKWEIEYTKRVGLFTHFEIKLTQYQSKLMIAQHLKDSNKINKCLISIDSINNEIKNAGCLMVDITRSAQINNNLAKQ